MIDDSEPYDPLIITPATGEVGPAWGGGMPPPHVRVAERWNNLAVDDRITISGRRGTYRVIARSAEDDDRIIVQLASGVSRLEPLSAKACTLVPPPQPRTA